MNPEERQFEEELMKLAANTHPNPEFQHKLADELRAAQDAEVKTIRPRWSMIAAALIVVALVGVMMAAPLTSLAQDFFDSFFNRSSDVETFEQSIQMPIGPTPQAEAAEFVPQSVEDVRAEAPFAVKVPTYIPEGFTIIDASYDPGANQTSIFIGTSFDALNLVQTPLEDAEPFDIGESADVTEVQIGDYTGEFVRGVWLARTTTDGDTLSAEGREWDSDFPFEQLVWTDGEYRYWLSSVMGQGTSLSLAEWVSVAESLQ